MPLTRRRTPRAAARGLAHALLTAGVMLLSACSLPFVSGSDSSDRVPPAVQDPGNEFRPGDMVRVTVRGVPELSGEYRVDNSMVLDLGRLGTLPLQGVERSELPGLVEARVDQVMVDATVQVESLMRVAVLGAVSNPGFYFHPPEATLYEVLDSAGGPMQNASLEKIEIRRTQATVVSEEESSEALSYGLSLEQLGLRSGDRVEVGREAQRNWLTTARDAAYVVGAVATLIAIFSRF